MTRVARYGCFKVCRDLRTNNREDSISAGRNFLCLKSDHWRLLPSPGNIFVLKRDGTNYC